MTYRRVGAACAALATWLVLQPAAAADNGAVFVSQNVPSRLAPGQRATVSVTMHNSGTTSWTPEGEYKLGSQNPEDNDTWGTNRVYLDEGDVVEPGQDKTFTFAIIAPSSPGLYHFQWRMVQDLVEWFGAFSGDLVVSVAAAPAGNDAVYAGQNVLGFMGVGDTVTVSVTMRNTGGTTWTAAGQYHLGSQNPQDNLTWGLNRVYLDDGDAIAPGQQKTFTFDITAPRSPGHYRFQWRMVQDGVEWFGGFTPDHLIQVSFPVTGGNAAFVSQSVPTAMGVGETRTVSVTMRNTGSTTWTRFRQYKLGSQNPENNLTWGPGRAFLDEADQIQQGEEKTFTFAIRAPTTPGSYNFQWRMLQENVVWFGDLTPNVVIQVTAAVPRNGARFIRQQVPDRVAPGQRFFVTITMQNAGTGTWSESTQHRLGSQNPENNLTWGLGRLLIDGAVAPGGQVTFSFTAVAPSTPGSYNFQWRMLQERVEWFGDLTPNVPIGVGGGCTGGNPTDDCPDDDALQALLDAGGTVRLAPGSPGYIIAKGLRITVDGTVITSSQAPTRATLVAAPSLGQAPFANPVLAAIDRRDFVIEHLVVDGNKARRPVVCQGYRDYGTNLRLVGGRTTGFVVRNITSQNAKCGSALEIDGADFEVAGNTIRDNGFTRAESSEPEPWSDGITLGRCQNGWAHDNTVTDNTDVGIISGGGAGCLVERNTITQSRHAFAGLAVHNFALGGAGEHAGAIYRQNTISSQLNGLDLGISVGIHPWDLTLETSHGSVLSNVVSGAVVNLAVDGYHDGTITGNALSNPQGRFSHFKPNCTFSGNYTIGHNPGGALQPGAVAKTFHGDGCQ